MSVFEFPYNPEVTEDEANIVRLALSLDLSVSRKYFGRNEDSAPTSSYIFISWPEEAWRSQVYIATRKILHKYGWSNGAEYLESFLLGYSEEQIQQWLFRIEQERISWEGKNFYMLASIDDAEHVLQFSKRIVPLAGFSKGHAFFFKSNLMPVRDAFGKLPKNMTLMRAAMRWQGFTKIYGDSIASADDLVSAEVSAQHASAINSHLVSNIQFLDEHGWL